MGGSVAGQSPTMTVSRKPCGWLAFDCAVATRAGIASPNVSVSGPIGLNERSRRSRWTADMAGFNPMLNWANRFRRSPRPEQLLTQIR